MNHRSRLLGLCLSTVIAWPIAAGATVTTVASFGGSVGHAPTGRTIRAADGNVYGMAKSASSPYEWAYDTVYRMTPAGALSVVTRITAPRASIRSLIPGRDGNLYGVVVQSGDIGVEDGPHTLIRVTPTGQQTVIATFPDDQIPETVMQASDGNFYCTTFGYDIVRVKPDGTVTTLVTFPGPEGNHVSGALIEAHDGAFYGTAQGGFTVDEFDPSGSIFRMTLTPAGTAVVATIARFTDYDATGDWPVSLTEGDDGNLYGLTRLGGEAFAGTVFRVTPAGKLTKLADLDESPVFGGTLVRGLDGNFHTVTENPFDGASQLLTVTPLGVQSAETIPLSGAILAMRPNGAFYGTTMIGGAFNLGSVLLQTSTKRITTLTAQSAVANLSPLQLHLKMKATLSAASPTLPLSGKVVKFSASNGDLLCSAVTDASGVAACGTVVTYVRDVYNSGFVATFAGDATYASSSALGPLVK